MLVIAVTAAHSRDIWRSIVAALPSAVRTMEMDLSHAGRFRTAASIMEGLEIIRALGAAAEIDPGKPARGSFAEAIYGDTGLISLAGTLGPAARHKLQAVHYYDDPNCPSTDVSEAHKEWLNLLSEACIGGILLDYDGTVVATESRLDPPESAIVSELIRLADAGIAVGFATGRGGSAGVALRKALPERLHPNITIGYYNGGHVRTLDVNIEDDRPQADASLAVFAELDRGEVATCLRDPFKARRGADHDTTQRVG